MRLTEEPDLADAIESVKRLRGHAQSLDGSAKKAVEALIFIFTDLFRCEKELDAARKMLAEVEMKVQAKEAQAEQAETKGSPLTGPNPRLAALYRQDAAGLRERSTQTHDAALLRLKQKIAAYNHSVAYFIEQGDMEVVIALAGSLFAIVDRHLPGYDFSPRVSREWLARQKTAM